MNQKLRSGSSRLLGIGGFALLVLTAACSGKLDNQFGPAPSASGGVAGWVLNGEAGDGASHGGSSAGRRNDRPAPGIGGGASGDGSGSSGRGGSPTAGSSSTAGASGSGAAGAPGGGGGAVFGSAGTGGLPTGDPRGGEGGAGADVPPRKVHAFVISEYVEGSSNNKAIELYASEASTLDGCELHFYFNGGVEPSVLALEGSVAEGGAYAVCTQELAVQVSPRCARVASLRFNGNDAVSLVCDGVVLDSFGKVGDDPGKGWGTDDTTTVDRTLRRRCDAMAEPTLNDDFDPALAWEVFPADSFDDLGARVCAPDEGQAGAPGHAGEAGSGGEAGLGDVSGAGNAPVE
jgi:hypothetical protein